MKQLCEGGVRKKYNRNNPADTTVNKEGWRGAPGVGAEALQPLEKDMVKQIVSLQPMEDHAGGGVKSEWEGAAETVMD